MKHIPLTVTPQLVLIHPNICLVLRAKESDCVFEFERIGIIRQPISLLLLYQLDWMHESKLTEVTIV